VTLNFDGQEARTLLHWTAEVFATGAGEPEVLGVERETLSERLQMVSRIQSGAEQLGEEEPHAVEALAAQLEGFRRKLKFLAITPAEVYLSMHPARAIFFMLREAELTFVGLPMALWGFINHLPAMLTVKLIERSMTKAEDQWASNTFFPALALFPLFFFMQLGIASYFLSAFWTFVYAVSVPFAGIYLTSYRERIGGILRRSRTFVYFLFHRNAQRKLMEEGQQIVAEIRRLAQMAEPAAPSSDLQYSYSAPMLITADER